MSASLKVLLYIFFVVLIFFFVQERFNIFDISFDGEEEKETVKEEEEVAGEDTIELYNEDGDTVLVKVDISDTDFERIVGLSGRQALGDYEGMLFIMDEQANHAFWMKDMLISLDMIFIDNDGFIVDIKENLKPCSSNSCPNIYPNSPSRYILEVNSGFAESNRIKVGNSVIFNISSSL